jgi:hypothetical protein
MLSAQRWYLTLIFVLTVAGVCICQTPANETKSITNSCQSFSSRAPEFQRLSQACEYALALPQTLPDFVCTERVDRYYNPQQKPDLITAELSVEHTKSHYSDVIVNGEAVSRPGYSPDELFEEEAGTTGEFLMLFNVFDPGSLAEFSPPVNEQLGSVQVQRFDFRVHAANNHNWTWFFVGRSIRPGYHGSIFVEKETGQVARLRVQVTSQELDPQTPISEQTITIDYHDVLIPGLPAYRLPTTSESLSCFRVLLGCARYVQTFHDFHKFGAATRILP